MYKNEGRHRCNESTDATPSVHSLSLNLSPLKMPWPSDSDAAPVSASVSSSTLTLPRIQGIMGIHYKNISHVSLNQSPNNVTPYSRPDTQSSSPPPFHKRIRTRTFVQIRKRKKGNEINQLKREEKQKRKKSRTHLRTRAQGMDRVRWVVGLGFWVQGFRCLPWMGLNFFLKDGLGIAPATMQLLQNSANLPMVGKPLYGVVSDSVYIRRQHRLPYVAIGGERSPHPPLLTITAYFLFLKIWWGLLEGSQGGID